MALRPTGEADAMITLAENRYGKSRVRVVKVTRHPDRHDFREWTVEILRRRLRNEQMTELHEAAEQQRLITHLRLKKWLS